MIRAGVAALLVFVASVAHAQDKCDPDNSAFAASEHNAVAGVLHAESIDYRRTWCRLWNASTWTEREYQAGDFARVLFSSDGIQPAFGAAAQNSGLGGGASFNMSPAKTNARYGFYSVARAAVSGSWDVGAQLNIVGSAGQGEAGHAYGSIDAQHIAATQRVFFVEAPSGATQTYYRLDQTTARGVYHSPEFGGVSILGEAGVADFRPGHSDTSPSTDSVVSDATTPGLVSPVTYGVFGGGLNWHHPVDEHSTGYSTQLASSLRFYQGTSAYSFRRADVTWAHQYIPDTDKFQMISAAVRLITTTPNSGSRVPFYLQPALGGNDLGHDAGLRSYEYGRFHALDTLAAQAEYTRVFWGPLGFLVFADAATSGDALGSLGAWHQSAGVGLVVYAGGVARARVYIAWGGGHRASGGTDNTGTWLDAAQRGVY